MPEETLCADKTDWKLLQRRVIVNIPGMLIHGCEDGAIEEIFIYAKDNNFIPQDIKVSRKNNTSLISIDCRPSKNVCGKVLCSVSGQDRPSIQWYGLDDNELGKQI